MCFLFLCRPSSAQISGSADLSGTTQTDHRLGSVAKGLYCPQDTAPRGSSGTLTHECAVARTSAQSAAGFSAAPSTGQRFPSCDFSLTHGYEQVTYHTPDMISYQPYTLYLLLRTKHSHSLFCPHVLFLPGVCVPLPPPGMCLHEYLVVRSACVLAKLTVFLPSSCTRQ